MQKCSRSTDLMLVLMGAMILLNNLGKPRVEALHGSDIVGIILLGRREVSHARSERSANDHLEFRSPHPDL